MFKNKTIIGLICVALSVAIILVVSPLIQRVTMETTKIVRVTNNITQGTKLTKDNTEVVEISGYNMPNNLIKKQSEVVGKYATCDMKSGDYFMKSKLTNSGDATDDVLRNLYKQGKQAFSFDVKDDFSSSLSGKIKQGDIIRLYHQDKKESNAYTPNECQFLYVITATTSKGVDTQDIKANDDGTKDLPTTITVIVNDEQAKVLQKCKNGENSFSLVYRGDTDTAKKYIEVQDQYFKSGKFETNDNSITIPDDLKNNTNSNR